jgi:hypothetical protein
MGRAKLQCTEAFFSSQLSAPFLLKLSPFQALTHLGGGPKIVNGKESFSSSYKGALAGATTQ